MNKKLKIKIIPEGGLANRMRTIMSALALSKTTNRDLEVIWHKDDGLNAEFSDLFIEDNLPFIVRKVSDFRFYALHSVPRKKNLYFTVLTALFDPDKRIFHTESNLTEFSNQKLLDTIEDSGQDFVISSGFEFYPYDYSELKRIFQPSLKVIKRKEELCSSKDNLIGLHIRRTDNKTSIDRSPVSLFEIAINKEKFRYPDMMFYVASDDQTIKEYFKQKFYTNIIYNPEIASRNTKEGMIDACAELFILSETKKIYGSYWSSFSEMAFYLGDSELEILKTNNKKDGVTK